MRTIQNTGCYSYKIGALAEGCRLCMKGRKSVLFVTGLCSRKCFYCPISDKRYGKDVVYINEWPTKKEPDIIEEIRLCSSEGIGITGGDPLEKLERTVALIKKLKQVFGKKFHIHLYTPMEKVTKNRLLKLFSAGLDEIRFHPNILNRREWKKLLLADLGWDAGIEIPSIPGRYYETLKLLEYCCDIPFIKFININELELSDTNANKLTKLGFRAKDSISYAIKGSEEMSKELLRKLRTRNINVHYCTAKLKDKVQLAKRIKLRSKKASRPYDIRNADGTLTRGSIYLKSLSPGMGYRNKIGKANRKIVLEDLRLIRNKIMAKFGIPEELIETDETKLRILTGSWIVEELRTSIKSLNLIPAIVTEYPTHDSMELDIEFL